MSDAHIRLQWQIQGIEAQLERLRKPDVSALRPPYAAVTLSPTAVTATMGAFHQAGVVNIIAFRCSVFVSTTNDASNFWTITLQTTAAVAIASFTTAGELPNTWVRFAVTSGITQPASTNVAMLVTATTTLSPGACYVIPEVLLLES